MYIGPGLFAIKFEVWLHGYTVPVTNVLNIEKWNGYRGQKNDPQMLLAIGAKTKLPPHWTRSFYRYDHVSCRLYVVLSNADSVNAQ